MVDPLVRQLIIEFLNGTSPQKHDRVRQLQLRRLNRRTVLLSLDTIADHLDGLLPPEAPVSPPPSATDG